MCGLEYSTLHTALGWNLPAGKFRLKNSGWKIPAGNFRAGTGWAGTFQEPLPFYTCTHFFQTGTAQ